MSPDMSGPMSRRRRTTTGMRRRSRRRRRGRRCGLSTLKSRGRNSICRRLHRARERLVGERTALINQLRAVLLERGIIVPRAPETRAAPGRAHGRAKRATEPRMQRAASRISATNGRRSTDGSQPSMRNSPPCARTDEAARRLATIPGIGVDQRHRPRRRGRRCRERFAQGTRSGRLARACATTVHDRRQAKLLGISKRGQQVSAQAI